MVIAACTSSKAPTSSSTGTGGAKTGGTLKVAVETDVREMTQLELHDPVSKTILGSTVFDPLFTIDTHSNSVPALASAATSTPDFLTWTFTIRSGVKFQNGKPFTANDVKLNLDAYLDPKNASNSAVDLGNVKSYAVTSPTQIQITLKSPDAHLPALFTDAIFMADMEPGDYNATHPIGTGPYTFVSRVAGSSLTFKRNPDYWRGRPPLDQVLFQVVPDPQVAALELESGEVDIVANYLDITSLPALSKDKDVKLHSTQGGTFYVVHTDFEKDRRGGYKNGQDIRQGLAYLWDPSKIITPVIGAFGSVAVQPIPGWQPGNDPSLKAPLWPYDPTQGEQLLAEGGIPKGGTIKVLVRTAPYNCDVATAFQSQMKQLGYKVQLTCLDPSVADPATQKYDWDLLLTRHTPSADAAASYQNSWSVDDVPNPPDDVETLRDQNLQTVLDQMTATADPTKYAALGAQAADIIMKQDIASLPGYFDTVLFAARSNINGVVPAPTAYNGFLMNSFTTVSIG
jgi:peptide/nickel transport system substrate-binding protein